MVKAGPCDEAALASRVEQEKNGAGLRNGECGSGNSSIEPGAFQAVESVF